MPWWLIISTSHHHAQHQSSPTSHLPELEKRSATEEIQSTFIPSPVDTTNIQLEELEVLRQALTAENYKAKFCQLLRCEELTHAKILKER